MHMLLSHPVIYTGSAVFSQREIHCKLQYMESFFDPTHPFRAQSRVLGQLWVIVLGGAVSVARPTIFVWCAVRGAGAGRGGWEAEARRGRGAGERDYKLKTLHNDMGNKHPCEALNLGETTFAVKLGCYICELPDRRKTGENVGLLLEP